MPRKNSPGGCQCCGPPACDVSPFCTNAFPTNAFIGDGNGTTTMPRIAVSNTQVSWQSAPVTFSQSAFKFHDFSNTTCDPDGSTAKTIYTFTLRCQGSAPNKGKLLATLTIARATICCQDAMGNPHNSFASTTPSAASGFVASGVQPYTCDDTVFDFIYPTTFTNPSCLPDVLNTPGGGGNLSVTF